MYDLRIRSRTTEHSRTVRNVLQAGFPHTETYSLSSHTGYHLKQQGQHQVIFTAQSWSDTETTCVYEVSNYKATTQITWYLLHAFSALKSKCRRRVLEIDPDCLHTCCICPGNAVDECFFFHRNFWSKNIPKNTKIHIWHKIRNKKTHTATGWQGFIEHVCQITGSSSKKRREYWMLNKFGAINLIPGVRTSSRLSVFYTILPQQCFKSCHLHYSTTVLW